MADTKLQKEQWVVVQRSLEALAFAVEDLQQLLKDRHGRMDYGVSKKVMALAANVVIDHVVACGLARRSDYVTEDEGA